MFIASSQKRRQRGVALTELVLLVPFVFVLLEGLLLLSNATAESLQRDTKGIQKDLQSSLARHSQIATHGGCIVSALNVLRPVSGLKNVYMEPSLPQTFSQQRLLFLSGMRAACLAEGSLHLTPAAASALFAALTAATDVSTGRSIALTLCPATARSTQALRTGMISVMHLTSQEESLLLARSMALEGQECRK